MGGVVKTGEKVMGTDSVYVTDLDVSGIPDGIIKLTVQLKDSLDQLVATTTTDYTKDVILPNSYYFQANLQNVGSSNIDSLEITINTVEVNGDYELIIIGDSIIGGNSIISLDETNGPNYDLGGNLGLKSKKIIRGKITNEALKIDNIDLSNFADGFITLDLVVTDSALNIGNEIFKDSIFKNLPDAPVSLDLDSLMTDEDITLDFVLSASDADGDSLEFIIVRQPNNGIVVISDSIASYTPNNNYYGLDSLSYKASDGSLESETSEVSISINSVYDLPSVSLFTNNINLIEESGFSEIVVKAEGIDAGDKEISVTLSFTGSSSSADFDISSDSIVINAGDTEEKINLNVVDDIEFEQEETIIIDIDSVYNGLEDSIQQIIITILESDRPLGNESKSIIYKIYPNPAKHHIIIELNDNYILKDINVIDLSGKFAKTNFSTEKNKSKVDVSMLSEGIFILNIITDKGSTNFRFNIEK
tara:strand:- start:34 stop:1461 length:1428 start_codon:yes stop_codon:yes gene_type:complete